MSEEEKKAFCPQCKEWYPVTHFECLPLDLRCNKCIPQDTAMQLYDKRVQKAGHDVEVPFTPGRTDASLEQTDVNSFEVLEPAVDGFRNYIHPGAAGNVANAMIDKANLLMLTAPEMTVLVGGMRALGATSGNVSHGVFTERPGTLTPDFFTNLLDMRIAWKPAGGSTHLFEGTDRKTGERRWTATLADLIFGSNAQLRALSEVYAARDGEAHFVQDFVTAWAKVMELDRFDLEPRRLSIEILENVVAETDNDVVVANIAALAKLGCGIDLDDFGTGHASITSIRRFTVRRIKIDRSFVTKLDEDREQQKMVAAILSMAERLGLETLAEGVETPGEHALLAQLGCGDVQGFGIARPMPIDDTMEWIARHRIKLGTMPKIGTRAR